MPGYIKYNKKKKVYEVTKKRPNNQSSKKNLVKISDRLSRYEDQNPGIELTEGQRTFVDHFAEANEKGEKYKLSEDDFNIAHGVAISSITSSFAAMMSHPASIDLDAVSDFCDSILSTDSEDDDKGRAQCSAFFSKVKNNPEKIAECVAEANKIIPMLNRSTRNLTIGYASANKSIQEHEDPQLVNKKNDPNRFKQMMNSKNIKRFFNALPGADGVSRKIDFNEEAEPFLSSSANCYVAAIDDNGSDSDSNTSYETIRLYP